MLFVRNNSWTKSVYISPKKHKAEQEVNACGFWCDGLQKLICLYLLIRVFFRLRWAAVLV